MKNLAALISVVWLLGGCQGMPRAEKIDRRVDESVVTAPAHAEYVSLIAPDENMLRFLDARSATMERKEDNLVRLINSEKTRAALVGLVNLYKQQMSQSTRNLAIAGTTRDGGNPEPPKPMTVEMLPDGGYSIVPRADPFRTEYQPNHPAADADGNIRVPNVSEPTEMVDMMVASRGYERAMEILRRFDPSVIQ